MTKTEEMKLIMTEIQKLHEGLKSQNRDLINVVRYYAETDWRELSLTDRGIAAQTLLKKVMGVDDDRA